MHPSSGLLSGTGGGPVAHLAAPAGKLRARRARPLATNQARPASTSEPEQNFWALLHITPAIGVESNRSWPCGQDSQPKPECHQRRDLRHEARGAGYWF
jgi:hypothetical protein